MGIQLQETEERNFVSYALSIKTKEFSIIMENTRQSSSLFKPDKEMRTLYAREIFYLMP